MGPGVTAGVMHKCKEKRISSLGNALKRSSASKTKARAMPPPDIESSATSPQATGGAACLSDRSYLILRNPILELRNLAPDSKIYSYFDSPTPSCLSGK